MLLVRSTYLSTDASRAKPCVRYTDAGIPNYIVLHTGISHRHGTDHKRYRLCFFICPLGRQYLRVLLHRFEFSFRTRTHYLYPGGHVVCDGVLHHIEQSCRSSSCSHFELGQALSHHGSERLVSARHAEHGRDLYQGILLGSYVDLEEPCLVERTVQKCQQALVCHIWPVVLKLFAHLSYYFLVLIAVDKFDP